MTTIASRRTSTTTTPPSTTTPSTTTAVRTTTTPPASAPAKQAPVALAADLAVDLAANLSADVGKQLGIASHKQPVTSNGPARVRGFVQLPGVVDVASLQRLSSARLAQLPALTTIAAVAKDRGVDVSLVGAGACAFADLAKAAALVERGDTRFAPAALGSSSLRSLVSPHAPQLALVVDGNDADIAALRDAVTTAHGASTAALLSFTSSSSSSSSSSSGIAVDLLSGRLRGAVADFANNTIRLPSSTPTLADALELLVTASAHGLNVQPSSLAALRAVFAAATPKSFATHDAALTAIVRGAVDVRHTWQLLDQVGARTAIASSSAHAARHFERIPLPVTSPTAPVSRAGRPTAAELGVTQLWHGTYKHETRVGMTSTVRTTPNLFVSNDEGSTTAVYGAGVYCTRAGDRYVPASSGAYPFNVKLRLADDAARGIDFDLVTTPEGAVYVLLLRADKLHLDEQPVHRMGADEVVTALLDPLDASPQHAPAAWAERLREPEVGAKLVAALSSSSSSSLSTSFANIAAVLEGKTKHEVPAVFAAVVDGMVRAGALSDVLGLVDGDAQAAVVVKDVLGRHATSVDDVGAKAARFLAGFAKLFP
ncbi:MAG TPA: hypothetical protein VGF99_13675 [Myxococcota bacterium]